MRRYLLILGIVPSWALAGCSQTVLTAEPKPGELKPGQTVLVNDGTCAAGQIKKVTGGNRQAGVGRQTECVPAPAP